MRQLKPPARFATRWLRRLAALLLALYFVLGLGLLALRYVLLPSLDHWRPQIQARISAALGVPVEIGRLRAEWRRWTPILELEGVVLRDAGGAALLSIPQARARLSLRSVVRGQPGLRLAVSGMDVGLRRDTDGALHILGQRLHPDDEGDSDAHWLAWIMAQPSIALRDTTIRWVDELRQAPELVFTDVQARLDGSQAGVLTASFSMRPSQALGSAFQLRVRIEHPERLAAGRWPERYRLYAATEDMQAPAWRPWVEIPTPLRRGRMSARVWAESDPRVPPAMGPQLVVQGDVDDVEWDQRPLAQFLAPRVRLHAQGPWRGWQAAVLDEPVESEPLQLAVQTTGLVLRRPEWFEHPIALGQLDAEARLRLGEVPSLRVERLLWRNPDIELTASGRWQAGGRAGQIDAEGTIARARLDALHRYMPQVVDEDARAWLRQALQAGTVHAGRFELRGDLAEFPFGDAPEAGDFLVQGQVRDARIDYIPEPGAGEKPWPALDAIQGSARLRRADLAIQARQARMPLAGGGSLALSDISARIPNIEHDVVLDIQGDTRGQGADYLRLTRQSPLGELLEGVFEQAQARGEWQMPLALHIPISTGEDVRVSGRVVLDDAWLQLAPSVPPFEHIKGGLSFTETELRFGPGLGLQVLGGPTQLSGALGFAGQRLQMQGRLAAEALAQRVGVPGMKRIQGILPYQAELSRNAQGYAFNLESNLEGLALDFPAPLAKPATQPRRFRLAWSGRDSRDDSLSVELGTDLAVQLRHRRKQRGAPYFAAASVGVGRAAPELDGFTVDVAAPLLDLDEWRDIVDEFTEVGPASGGTSKNGSGSDAPASVATGSAWLPPLRTLSLQADQLRLMGMRLDEAVLRVSHEAAQRLWSVNLRSAQTTGTIKWQDEGDRPGKVSARFARLGLGEAREDGHSLLPEAPERELAFDDELNMPAVVVQADELVLYGHAMGPLSLDGTRDESSGDWRLNALTLGTDQARLKGSGLWRLRGEDRGLRLKATVQVADGGAWLEHAGFHDVMDDGQGQLSGELEWRDLPWTQQKKNLAGSVRVELDKGRFNKLGSHSAKLLELLSLQSITRLGSLDRGLAGLTQEGFPYDKLRGSMTLAKGVVHTQDYKVIGPVGTIVLEGDADIIARSFDLQAVIVPNIDVSGAALAAGIAINPVVGIGAFLSQWLLKNPLGKAMAARYRVTGPWDDPVVKELPEPPSKGEPPKAR